MPDPLPSPPPPAPRSRTPALVLAVGALLAVAASLWLWTRPVDQPPAPSASPLAYAPLPAMQPLAMDALPALPAQPGDGADSPLEDLRRGRLPSTLDELDTLAWADVIIAGDNALPPIPQRIAGDDLRRGQVARGAAVRVVARMEECVPVAGRDALRWISLALEDRHYCLALAPASAGELPLNAQVQAVGRFIGSIELAVAGGTQRTPLLLLRLVANAKSNVGAPTADPLAEFHTSGFNPPADIHARVDDELPLLETRPYYYALGQAKSDLSTPAVFDDALSANAQANAIHQNPAEFRGRTMSVTGWVYDAWEDEQVAQDRPFEVTRVVRMLVHSSDVGPFTEDGVTTTKAVLRLYEVAVIGDLPLPKRGERVEAWGRFLKWRAIPVPHDPGRDAELGVSRQSDNVYTLFVVATRYHVLSAKVLDLGPARIVVVGIAVGLCLIAVLFMLRDVRADRRARAAREARAGAPRRSGRRRGPDGGS